MSSPPPTVEEPLSEFDDEVDDQQLHGERKPLTPQDEPSIRVEEADENSISSDVFRVAQVFEEDDDQEADGQRTEQNVNFNIEEISIHGVKRTNDPNSQSTPSNSDIITKFPQARTASPEHSEPESAGPPAKKVRLSSPLSDTSSLSTSSRRRREKERRRKQSPRVREQRERCARELRDVQVQA